MDKKKEEVYQHLIRHTAKQLQQRGSLGRDALNISLDLQMDRSNVSRLLNQLHHEGRLIKTQGRPTLFFARTPLENEHPDVHIPSVIPKGKSIQSYLKEEQELKNEQTQADVFRQYLANRNTSSMFEPIQRAKSALLYPPQGLNILLYGDPCVGKLNFAKTMFEFCLQRKIFTHGSRIVVFDCLNYADQEPEEILSKLYGYYDGSHLKKGLLEASRNGMLILNHMDRLSFSALTSLYNSMISQSYTPLHLPSKEYPIRSLIVGISNTENMILNPDIRRCFPMQIHIPCLREKSIQEMLVLTMQYFQQEAAHINKTIRISKGALSCFVMSDYSGNLPHLHAEIKQACAHAFRSYLEQEALFVSIDYDDISTQVLTDIYDVNERMSELDNILNLFAGEYLFFSALKQNQELELLYDLNDGTSKKDSYLDSIDDKLINLCIQDINAAIGIHLNTIRSVMLKQVYDLLYPILQNNPICKNENLLYGLLLHVSNSISRIRSGNQELGFRRAEYRIAKQEDYDCAQSIVSHIQAHQELQLPAEETDYIATYLYLSSQWIDSNYIQLLIISVDNDTAKEYADYLNSLSFKTEIHYLRLHSQTSHEKNCRLIADTMHSINRGKGVVIATDSSTVTASEAMLKKLSDAAFTIVSDISVKTLMAIVEKMESLGSTLSSIQYFRQENTRDAASVSETETHAQELLNDITNKVLSESLVFLNPHKVCQSLFNVLINILHDLNISYTDDLLIKFIFHSGFMIERCIRKEPLSYPKARGIINQYDQMYYIMEKNFEIISEIFNVTIPSSEMAMIMEIFLPYM